MAFPKTFNLKEQDGRKVYNYTLTVEDNSGSCYIDFVNEADTSDTKPRQNTTCYLIGFSESNWKE